MAESAPGDWSSARRDEKLQPLPVTVANSLDQHEIPAELGGSESAASGVALSATREHADENGVGATVKTNVEEAAGASMVERLPMEVWSSVIARMGNETSTSSHAPPGLTEDGGSCVSVTASAASTRHITVQLREQPRNATAALQAVSHALEEVEAHCTELLRCTSGVLGRVGQSTPLPLPITVTWCTLPHCTFFGSLESPAELSLGQRVRYVEAKEEVMARFHRLVRRMEDKARFVALASSAAGPVVDLGAEVFFACSERYLLPAQTSAAATEFSGEASTAAASAASVGFPLTEVGLYPSTSTVAALQRLCGSQSTIKWVPILHNYDVSGLEEVGLLRLGEPASFGTASMPGANADAASHADRSLHWSLVCERFILQHLCRSPAQRQWVLEKLLWSSDFQQAVSSAESRVMERTWYTYAMGVLCRDASVSANPTGPTAKEAEAEAPWTSAGNEDSARGGSADSSGSAALLRAFIATPPCKGAAHAVQVRVRSLRQPLPPLPHRRFLAFPHHQQTAWGKKIQALAATSESSGAAVLLDCSDKAVLATLELVETQFVATPAQRARLPYLNFVLIGEEAAVRPVLALLPCAAVVSSSSAFCELDHTSVQQVRLYATPRWPVDLQQDTLVAALAYLQRKATPHVVAAGAAPQQLLLALCREALTMALAMQDASRIEAAAQERLGLRLGPFALMDAYGAAAIADMAAAQVEVVTRTAQHDWEANARLESCARAMVREGLLGLRSVRGGFYGPAAAAEGTGGGAPRVLRDAVLDTYVRRYATSAEVADRLRAAVLNAACGLLVRGEVHCADDIDALSLSTLGWRDETGGVLYQLDQLGAEGLPRLVQFMTSLSSSGVAPHLAPHPLLSTMAARQLRFAQLESSGLLVSSS